jgi:serine/threonine-protein kinase
VRALLRWLGRLAYGVCLLVAFVLAAYLTFSGFVRGGVTRVPDLTGASEEEARTRLADAGLDMRRRSDEVRYDPRVPAGRILRQEPGSGSLVKRGTSVEVILSGGPQRLTTPELVGEALTAAQVTLVAAGLRPGASATVFHPGTSAGVIVEQMPRPGALVDPTTPVVLLAALEDPSETYLMPDLVYRRYDDVRPFFDGQGFRLGSIKFEPYEGVEDGVVLRQFPLAGHPLRRGDVISLVVSGGDELAPLAEPGLAGAAAPAVAPPLPVPVP